MVSMPSLAQLRKDIEEIRARRADAVDPEDARQVVEAMRSTIPLTPDAELAETPEGLHPQLWSPFRFHPEQARLWGSEIRFDVDEAGRRSGKSANRKRKVCEVAIDPDWPLPDRYIVVGAPTHEQAQKLYWDDLIQMIPARFVLAVEVSKRRIRLKNGANIYVLGMDRPQRAEGFPIDFLFLDEYADMKASVWKSHLRPSLSTPGRPPGRASFFGTPDMASGEHFMQLADFAAESENADWERFHWSSQGIIADAEFEAAKKELPPNEFAVEYLAERRAMGDLAYYCYDQEKHLADWVGYVPTRPIQLCLDYNISPGVAVITQLQSVEDYEELEGWERPEWLAKTFTSVIAEVYIPQSSTTPMVMDAFLDRFGGHKAGIQVYGDASGGAGGTAQVDGSDWDLVTRKLRSSGLPWELYIHRRNPAVRSRVNALNGRLMNAAGEARLVFSRTEAKETARDVSRVTWKEGAPGHLDKSDLSVTHCSDALGYWAEYEYPVDDVVAAEVRPWAR